MVQTQPPSASIRVKAAHILNHPSAGVPNIHIMLTKAFYYGPKRTRYKFYEVIQ